MRGIFRRQGFEQKKGEKFDEFKNWWFVYLLLDVYSGSNDWGFETDSPIDWTFRLALIQNFQWILSICLKFYAFQKLIWWRRLGMRSFFSGDFKIIIIVLFINKFIKKIDVIEVIKLFSCKLESIKRLY